MWHEFSNSEQWVDAQVRAIYSELSATLAEKDQAGLAVSGGRSPIPLYQELSKADLDWERVHITLVDERFVPPDHADSNEALVRDNLLINRASVAKFTGLVCEPEGLEYSVQKANQITDPITIAILGMGDDGHTASLFPEAEQLPEALLAANPQRYIHVSPPSAPHERISMTLPAILKAEHIFLGIAGRKKRQVYERALKAVSSELPVSYVVHQTKAPIDVYWYE